MEQLGSPISSAGDTLSRDALSSGASSACPAAAPSLRPPPPPLIGIVIEASLPPDQSTAESVPRLLPMSIPALVAAMQLV